MNKKHRKIIEDMEEDDEELSEQTKKDVEISRKSSTISHEEVKKILGIS